MSQAYRLLTQLPSWPSPTTIWVLLAAVSLLVQSTRAQVIDPSTTLGCHVRKYRQHLVKPPLVGRDGTVYQCSGWVEVNSCWGRCDSSEIGDYLMPYKISNHPVCTYNGRVSRLVTLPDCPGYPNPTAIVFDATGCDCRLCNSDFTSCESLTG